MIRAELNDAFTAANGSNNVDTRHEIKINALGHALDQLLERVEGEGEPPADNEEGVRHAAEFRERMRQIVREELDAYFAGIGEVVFRGPGANEAVLQIYGEDLLAASKAVEATLTTAEGDSGGSAPSGEAEQGETASQSPDSETQPTTTGGEAPTSTTPNYANHTSTAPSTSPYDVLPERAKLERMSNANLIALAGNHGLTVPADGTKAQIIDAMIGPKAS